MLRALTAIVLISAGAPPASAQSWTFEDPAHDDVGPGVYTYPTRPAYRARDFDLRRVELRVEGSELLVRTHMARPVRRPVEQARRTKAIEIPLEAGLYVQHLDLYFWTETPAPKGLSTGLPGRRIRFERPWNAAVVMTPQPFLLRSMLKDWPGADATYVVPRVRAVGPILEARIPLAHFGGQPTEAWRLAVAVAGAQWENRFQFGRDAKRPWGNALTMPVTQVPDVRRFGGAPWGESHPQVIDVLDPGGEQRAWLSSFDSARERWAVLPALALGPPRS